MSSVSRARVYIGRIPYDCRERDLEKFMGDFGRIRDLQMKNHLPGRLGFAFVEFDDERDADDCVYELNGKTLLGERVLIEKTRRPPRQRDDYRDRGGFGGRYGGGGGRHHNSKFGPPTQTKYRMIVENLSTSISWQDLKDRMRKAGEVTYADTNPNRREGLVCFSSDRDLKDALSRFDGVEMSGRKIKCVDDSRKSRSRSRKRSRSSSSSSSSSGSSRSSRSSSSSRSRSRSKSPKRKRSKRDRKSRSKSKDRKSRSKDRKSRSKSKDRKSRSKDRKSRSKSKDRKSRSKSKDPKSRSKDRKSRSKDRKSRSKSKDRKSRSKSKDRKSRSRSVSKSRKSGSKSRSRSASKSPKLTKSVKIEKTRSKSKSPGIKKERSAEGSDRSNSKSDDEWVEKDDPHVNGVYKHPIPVKTEDD